MFDSPEFKALKELWYEKLKESGFKDHESKGGYLRGTEKRTWDRALADRPQREAYFDMAREVLHEFEFKNDLEKTIWELHSFGLSSRKISKTVKCPVATVKFRIKQIRLKAKL